MKKVVRVLLILVLVASGFTNVYSIKALALVGSFNQISTSEVVEAGDYHTLAIPTNPGNFMASSSSYSSIKTSWSAVDVVDGYEVYRSIGNTETYSLVGTVTTPTFTNTSLTTGTTYCYKVRSYQVVDSNNVYSDYSASECAQPVPSNPTRVQAISDSYYSIRINWTTVTGASGYDVYRSTTKFGTYAMIGTTNTNSFLNTGLTTGKVYYYKLKAYRTVGTTKVYSGDSMTASAAPIPATPIVTLTALSSSSLNVSWMTVIGASGYEIYRSTTKYGTYAMIKTLVGTSFTNVGLIAGKSYYYEVRAYRMVGTVKVFSAYSSKTSTQPVPATPTISSLSILINGELTVKVNPVSGANGYEIAYSTIPDFSSVSSIVTTSNTGIVNGLLLDTTYYVKVRAYCTVGTNKVFGAYSTVSSKTMTALIGHWISNLGNGNYTVGIDIPIGTYNLKATSGNGNVYSTDYSFTVGINEMMGIDTSYYIQTFSNLVLTKGTVLVIDGVNLDLESNNAELTTMIPRDQPNTTEYQFSSGNYSAGVDFVAGVYDIVWMSGSGNVYSSNYSFIGEGINAIMGPVDEYDIYEQQYENIILSASSVLSISGCNIKLIPSK